ncbi:MULTISPECIES: CPBP family intramembrane glutamic endopeptidase [unclassified Enterococcus]|uniref:CPBP family intramembrane glutamic endopeptidase n=1 Tax=unclassified Enterococcus TaxID=2608891 RepID=UPI001CE0D574|nr:MULTISPECIES: type II CAAX endopeptidase family protein [unclassified Enterococcus]MCA5011825.1 CPBP family intramembrane metalloprotease [Enterococcus sp. S23]MCA5014733.1 CPBP family intramembrane metalloprotease [Enterococcus sp. S22(2020)]
MLRNLSIKKLSIITILLYLLVFFSPYVFVPFSSDLVIIGTTVSYILGAAAMIWLYFKNRKTAVTITENEAKLTSPVFTLLLGISGIFLAMIIQTIVFSIEMAITGEQPSSQNTQNIIAIILANPLFILATTIGGPIMEEFVFRRSMIGLTENYTGFWIAAGISSALFSVVHQDGHFFVYFFMGFFFAILYKMTGKIWTSILAHCGMNTLVVIAQLILHYANIELPK